MMCNLSQLDGGKLEAIKSVEQKLGKTILAYNCYEIKPVALNDQELTQIKELEQKTGLVLVAVK